MDIAPPQTLKQKWNDHWNKRSFAPPPEQANLAGVGFFWTFTTILLITSLYFCVPHHYRTNDNSQFWASCFIYFIWIETVVNWSLCLKNNSNLIKSKGQLEQGSPEGWKYCVICQVKTPPRSHHCKICKCCIMKRDHHCFFTGNCVGFHNQRHFIVFTFYILLGSIYGTFLISHYLGQFYDVRSHEGWAFVPFVALWYFVFGYMSLLNFYMMVLMYVTFGMIIVSGYFFLWQMAVVLNGRTTHEVVKSIKKYQSKNVLHSLRSVFGPFWLIQFLIPVPTQLLGDGIRWDNGDGAKWQ